MPRGLIARLLAGQIAAPLVDTAPRRLCTVIARSSGGFGVAVLHGGEAVAFLTPAEARREALHLLDLANVAARPGECPTEDHG